MEYFEEPTLPALTIALAANEHKPAEVWLLREDHEIEIIALMAVMAGLNSFEARIQLPNTRYLSTERIHHSLMWGNANFPKVLGRSVVLHPNASLVIDIKNLTGVAGSVQLVMEAKRRIYR